jgi:predicted Ser/Thr protein kinase
LQASPEKERSIALATEVLDIAQQFPQVPMVQRYGETTIQVLQANGVEVDTLNAGVVNNIE